MGFFSSSSEEDEKSVEELNQDLEETERQLKEKQGERRLEELKKSKREKLRQKEKQLKKEKFKQSKAGKVIDTLGTELGKLAEATNSEKAEQLSEAAEKVDGDGKGDSSAALGIGLESKDKARDIEVEGNLEVEGDIVTEDSGNDSLSLTTDEDDQGGIF